MSQESVGGPGADSERIKGAGNPSALLGERTGVRMGLLSRAGSPPEGELLSAANPWLEIGRSLRPKRERSNARCVRSSMGKESSGHVARFSTRVREGRSFRLTQDPWAGGKGAAAPSEAGFLGAGRSFLHRSQTGAPPAPEGKQPLPGLRPAAAQATSHSLPTPHPAHAHPARSARG